MECGSLGHSLLIFNSYADGQFGALREREGILVHILRMTEVYTLVRTDWAVECVALHYKRYPENVCKSQYFRRLLIKILPDV